jgi:hypothetical protein
MGGRGRARQRGSQRLKSSAQTNMAGPGADVHSLGADVAALLLCWLLDG